MGPCKRSLGTQCYRNWPLIRVLTNLRKISYLKTLDPSHSRWGLWTNNLGIAWELVSQIETQSPPRPVEPKSAFQQVPKWLSTVHMEDWETLGRFGKGIEIGKGPLFSGASHTTGLLPIKGPHTGEVALWRLSIHLPLLNWKTKAACARSRETGGWRGGSWEAPWLMISVWIQILMGLQRNQSGSFWHPPPSPRGII